MIIYSVKVVAMFIHVADSTLLTSINIDDVLCRLSKSGLPDLDLNVCVHILRDFAELGESDSAYIPDWVVATEDGDANIYLRDPDSWPNQNGAFSAESIIVHETAHIVLRRKCVNPPIWIDEAFAMLVADQIDEVTQPDHETKDPVDPYEIDRLDSTSYATIAQCIAPALQELGKEGLIRYIYNCPCFEADPLLGRKSRGCHVNDA